VGDRGAEERHDGVPDDLVDPATEGPDVTDEPFEGTVDDPLHRFRVPVLRQAGEPDEVGEEHRDHPSLLGPHAEGLPTGGAEPRSVLHRCVTRRAVHGASIRADPGGGAAGSDLCGSSGNPDTVAVSTVEGREGREDETVAEPRTERWVVLLAAAGAALVGVTNLFGIAIGDDGVGYRAIADSLLAGDGLGYFLEDPVTVWPPLWPALMALVAWVTPLDTVGAAAVLNVAMVFVAVLVAHRLLQRVLVDQRLVLAGTLVVALGPNTVGFGHLLMTDYAFAVVVMAWMLALMRFRRTGRTVDLLTAAALVWVGFGLRYVSVYLLGLAGLWLLFDLRRRFADRLVSAVVQGLVGASVPLLWMLRNRSIDGTLTGERHPSARGPLGNAYDIASTMGQWLLPGVGGGARLLWAGVGVVTLGVAAWLGWRVLRSPAGEDPTQAADPAGPPTPTLRRFAAWVGRPSGLLAVHAFGYLVYMLWVRTGTALNQLDMRLLNPAYLSLVALGLVLVDRSAVLGSPTFPRALVAARVWAGANVVVGLVAAVSFMAGDEFFSGNYEGERFRDARGSDAIDAMPDGCVVYSNLPNALYPRTGALWSPRRTALESSAELDELDPVRERAATTPTCLVWLDTDPAYGHLWPLDTLRSEIGLELLAEDGIVEVYRMGTRTG